MVTSRVEKTKLPLTQTSGPFKPIHTIVYTTWPCIKKDRVEITSCKRRGEAPNRDEEVRGNAGKEESREG